MEHRVLQTLQFSGLSAPTPLDFLDAFCTPLLAFGESIESNVPRCLSNFLLQLSLFNVALHYRYPHAILAAASVYVALCGLRVSQVVHHTLLHDVAAVCTEMPDVSARVLSCASELHTMWLEFVATQGQRVPCLLRKFSGSRLHTAVLLSPPATLANTFPACPIRANVAACNQERRCGQCGRQYWRESSAQTLLCPRCQYGIDRLSTPNQPQAAKQQSCRRVVQADVAARPLPTNAW